MIEVFNTVMAFVLMLFIASNVNLHMVKDTPGCFLDYRPGFKCLIYEKLP